MERQSGRSVVGPILLIAAGVALLLKNVGVIDWDVGTALVRLWPIALVALGLEILLGRRSAIGSLLVAALTVGMIAAGLWWLGAGLGRGAALSTETIDRPLGGARSAEVEVRVGAGSLDLVALTGSDRLVSGTVEDVEPGRLSEEYSEDEDTVRYTVKTGGAYFMPFIGSSERWDLALSPDVPMALGVHTGVGQADLDLRGLSLTELDVDIGVGRTVVTLPERGRFEANVDGGVGEVIVRVPESMAVRIDADMGLGGLDVDRAFTKRGEDTYESPGYEQARDRVALTVDGGIGRIAVRQVP